MGKIVELEKMQNYIPIYNILFDLTPNNFNNINLNNKYFVYKINNYNEETNTYNATIKNIKNEKETIKKNIFIKLSPIYDPFKYFLGKYTDLPIEEFLRLPNISFQETNILQKKIMNTNNSSYTDAFFYYLSGFLYNEFHFVNGIEYYGSYLGVKNNMIINIANDLDYLVESKFFIENNNKLFFVDDENLLFGDDNTDDEEDENKNGEPTKNKNMFKQKKKSLEIFDGGDNGDCDGNDFLPQLDILDIVDKYELNDITTTTEINTKMDIQILGDFDIQPEENDELLKTTLKSSGSSNCSSRTSNTEEENNDIDVKKESLDFKEHENEEDNCNAEDDKEYNNDNDEDDDEDDDDEYDDEEEIINARIEKFPVNVICIENCIDTFDNFLINGDYEEKELRAILMQIIMTLITYQKVFSMTHNDLHTNNIMYSHTDAKFIYYLYQKKYYKVPTFGKIIKIIDFNRSIYTYKNNIFYSDSFDKDGDASGQYNTEPFFDPKLKRVEPNYSFDLCRLACSMFDYFVDDVRNTEEVEKTNPNAKIIIDWVRDDKGKNILYKSNGDERYPEFKLYKMISRIVHNHTPENQLLRKEFKGYIVDGGYKKSDKNNSLLVDIDCMISFFN